MKKRILFFLLIFFIVLIFNINAFAQSNLAMSIRNHLIVIKEYEGHFPKDENISFYQELIDFYEQRYYRSIWFEETGFKKDPKALLKAIKNSYFEGLNPKDYHLDLLEECIDESLLFSEDCLDKRALVDILLTDAYLSLASDYLNGKIDAEIIIEDYNYEAEHLGSQTLLSKLTDPKVDIEKNIMAQLPKTQNYKKLKEKLFFYRDSGKVSAWPQIESGEILAITASGERVTQLIENLTLRNYLNKEKLQLNDYFNEKVEKAVIKFQLNHGLKADGIVGSKTLEALNISLNHRIKQLIINMERWRWLPENLGSRFIYVNIADYSLKL